MGQFSMRSNMQNVLNHTSDQLSHLTGKYQQLSSRSDVQCRKLWDWGHSILGFKMRLGSQDSNHYLQLAYMKLHHLIMAWLLTELQKSYTVLLLLPQTCLHPILSAGIIFIYSII